MNDVPELELIDLGDAKELTQGPPSPLATEDSSAMPERKPT